MGTTRDITIEHVLNFLNNLYDKGIVLLLEQNVP